MSHRDVPAFPDAIQQRRQLGALVPLALGHQFAQRPHRGFTAVAAKLASLDPGTRPGRLLVAVGTTLISNVGGASGPLYGTMFRELGEPGPARAGSRAGPTMSRQSLEPSGPYT